MEGDDEIQAKQTLLQTEIIEKNYDKTAFINFCLSKKENGDDLNNWTVDELTQIVHEFVSTQNQAQAQSEPRSEETKQEGQKEGEAQEIKKEDIEKMEKFMEDVEKGYIPNELVKKGITDLGIEMDDHRDEDYEPPKEEKKFHAFTGMGKSVSSVNTEGLHVDKNATSNADRTKPTCKVNIRLFNGEVVNEDFNLTQTLQDVINFVQKKSGSNNFSLLDGFPPRPLTDYNKTIKELHLEGSLLTQRIN